MSEPIRVLFVDDETKFLEATTTRLRARDLDVTSFTDAATALEAAKGGRFDVALLDLKMPGMDGEELLKRLKTMHPEMEVVILTGHGSVDSAVRMTKEGANEYLQKPCELDDVLTALTRAFAKRVTSRKASKADKVGAILEKAVGLSPIEILEQLREIDRAK